MSSSGRVRHSVGNGCGEPEERDSTFCGFSLVCLLGQGGVGNDELLVRFGARNRCISTP